MVVAEVIRETFGPDSVVSELSGALDVHPLPRLGPAACRIRTLTSWDPATSGALIYNDVFWTYDAVGLRGGP